MLRNIKRLFRLFFSGGEDKEKISLSSEGSIVNSGGKITERVTFDPGGQLSQAVERPNYLALAEEANAEGAGIVSGFSGDPAIADEIKTIFESVGSALTLVDTMRQRLPTQELRFAGPAASEVRNALQSLRETYHIENTPVLEKVQSALEPWVATLQTQSAQDTAPLR